MKSDVLYVGGGIFIAVSLLVFWLGKTGDGFVMLLQVMLACFGFLLITLAAAQEDQS